MGTPKTYEPIIRPTVDAEEVTPESIGWVVEWSRGRLSKAFDPEERLERIVGLNVVTPGGVKLAQWGWYVIKKLNGDFHVMDPVAFKMKYRLIEDHLCTLCGTSRCDMVFMKRLGCVCCDKDHGRNV